MNPRFPAKENPDSHAHPLYKALKRLAADLHTLFELASKEDEKSWHNYLALAKKEVEALQSHPDWKKDELLLYKSHPGGVRPPEPAHQCHAVLSGTVQETGRQ